MKQTLSLFFCKMLRQAQHDKEIFEIIKEIVVSVEIIKVKEQDDGMRLNRWFMKHYPGLSLAHFQKLLRTKQIKVDGKKVEASFKLEEGQEVRVPPLEKEKKPISVDFISDKDAEFIKSMVIYKDKDIVVLNKPSGIAVQGGIGTRNHIDRLLPALKFEAPEAPKLVHRIDKDTSGILVLARNRKSAEALTKAFREREVEKTYLAFCLGVPTKSQGEIKAPLEKVGEKVMAVEGGKKAVTEYEVISHIGKKFSLIEAKPLTGRTHQIRAHLEYLGTPIVGDNKYFGEEKRERFALFANKLHLHAYRIILNGKTIEAPLPQHMVDSLKEVGIEI